MCYSVAFLEKKLNKLAERYRQVLPPAWHEQLSDEQLTGELPSYYFVSGFSHPALPVVSAEGIAFSQWGLIPHWVKDDQTAGKLRKGTLNAVGETVFEKPSFRKSIRTRRGLLGINGFFEWRAFQNKKYPYFIYPANGELFSLGCLYDRWTDTSTGEILHTFSIITTEANSLMSEIHNKKKRMPLILHPEDSKNWVDPATTLQTVAGLIRPFDQTHMQAHPVSRKLNYTREERNTPEAVQRVSYAELPDLIS